jgi:hypothetical protein
MPIIAILHHLERDDELNDPHTQIYGQPDMIAPIARTGERYPPRTRIFDLLRSVQNVSINK